MSEKVTILAEIQIVFDGYAPKRIDRTELKAVIADAVCGCSQIEDVASVGPVFIEIQEKRKL